MTRCIGSAFLDRDVALSDGAEFLDEQLAAG